MKRCAFWAEEIQDAAIRCRYCGSSLPMGPGVDPDVLGADADVIESGRRYAVGVIDETYAVWDLLAPGTPLARYGGDSQGLELALGRYRELERMARGPMPWLGTIKTVFFIALAVWVVTRAITTFWFFAQQTNAGFLEGNPYTLAFAALQGLNDLAFGAWVGSLGALAFLWLADARRSRISGGAGLTRD